MALNDQGLDDRTEIVGTTRLLALSDGIFAIAATLLVLNLDPGLSLGDERLQLRIAAYVLSFVIVGTFWLGHHRMFSTIQRADSRLLALNIAFLFFVSALPYVTAVLNTGTKDPAKDSTALYAGTLALMALAELAIWLYACAGRRLVPTDLPRRVVFSRSLGMSAAALVFATSIPIAFFVDAGLAKYWWLLLIPIAAVLRRVFHTHGISYEPSQPEPASPSASSRSSSSRSSTRA